MSRLARSRPYLVLLVDEDLRTMRRLADMLRERGLAVQIACDGAGAVAHLARDPVPDALVTELTTAYADGASLGRFARWRRPGLPIFVVTGYPNLFDERLFGDPPAVMFTKPVDYAKLEAELLLAASSSTSDAPASVS
jgi:two-component system response regulator MprA